MPRHPGRLNDLRPEDVFAYDSSKKAAILWLRDYEVESRWLREPRDGHVVHQITELLSQVDQGFIGLA